MTIQIMTRTTTSDTMKKHKQAAMDLIEVALTDKRGDAGRESCSLTNLKS
jgi:hypothetical protein